MLRAGRRGGGAEEVEEVEGMEESKEGARILKRTVG